VPYGLIDINQVFASGHGRDIFRDREISASGAIVIVRPDQYVAAVLPLDAREQLTEFFAGHMLAPANPSAAPARRSDGMTVAEKTPL
jgi:phenol 2-monooxygenase